MNDKGGGKRQEGFSQDSQIFELMAQNDHEQLVHCYDRDTGLKAVIGIHSTVLGPAMGGTRLWNYASDHQATIDALRLSRGMTYKAAISGLNVGGGKAVLVGDAKKIKSEAYLRRFGQFVDSLNGKYVTAGDVNISTRDLEHISVETSHVTGLPESLGGGGASSLITAYGVYMGIKAVANQMFGADSLEGKRIAVQGVGAVGMKLTEYLVNEKAEVFVSDIDESKVQVASRLYGAHVVSSNSICDIESDIYAPCALGATLNDQTIPNLKCKAIAGGANNQLADEVRHGNMLSDRGIVYAPDFVVNAGGIMAVAAEYFGNYNKDYLYRQAEDIYQRCLQIVKEASERQQNAQLLALESAKQRIDSISNLRHSM